MIRVVKEPRKFIDIEGTDGSGKATQVRLLAERLLLDGCPVATFSFPQYGKPSARPVEEYLNPGKDGIRYNVGPYMASALFAADRQAAAKEIRRAMSGGPSFGFVLADRYVDSNAGHQGGKIHDEEERKEYLQWLYDFEYRVLRLPRPDLVIILHVPPKTGQQLVGKKKERSYLKSGTHDAHESSLQHLTDAEAAYLWLARQHPDDHVVVECMKNGELLPPDVIAEKVYKVVKSRFL